MRRRGELLAVAVLLAGLWAAPPALAQEPTAADKLFDQGLAGMLKGSFESGCPALAESYRLDPRAGGLFTLAECEAGWGRVASAVAHYREYLGLFERMNAMQKLKQKGRDKMAEKQIKELGPQVPQLTLTLPAAVPEGVTVNREGVVVPPASRGVALPVDPGRHRIEVSIPGRGARVQEVEIAKGEHKSVELRLPARRLAGEPAEGGAEQAGPEKLRGPSHRRTWALAAGSLGVVGLATGIIAGATSIEKKAVAGDNCPNTICNAEGHRANRTASALSALAGAGLAIGVAGFAGAAALWLTAPPAETGTKEPTTARRGLSLLATPAEGGAMVGLGGRW
ncbi:MAG: hypothetical protein HY744_10565 [Deltaproteobacteria bacterium]|nr:hypothetical protein [Deltaproteobacteria bacterium]